MNCQFLWFEVGIWRINGEKIYRPNQILRVWAFIRERSHLAVTTSQIHNQDSKSQTRKFAPKISLEDDGNFLSERVA